VALARATWDLLSDEAKAIILGLHKDPGKWLANLHNMSAFNFIQANMHDFHVDNIADTANTLLPDPDDDYGDAEAQAEEDNSTELLAFLSKQKGSTHPGHLENVLSTSKTKVLHLHPRMRKLWSMASGITKSTPIASFTLSPPARHANLVCLSIGVLMVGLLVMTFLD